MRYHQDVSTKTDYAASLPEVRALVAIGLTGDPVILSVSEGNRLFANEAKYEQAEIVLWPNELPVEPGLYEFRGYSAFESFDENPTGNVLVHRGQFLLVSPAQLAPRNSMND